MALDEGDDVLQELAAAGIGIASTTIAIVEAPAIRIAADSGSQPGA